MNAENPVAGREPSMEFTRDFEEDFDLGVIVARAYTTVRYSFYFHQDITRTYMLTTIDSSHMEWWYKHCPQDE